MRPGLTQSVHDLKHRVLRHDLVEPVDVPLPDRGVYSLGLNTTVLAAASAYAMRTHGGVDRVVPRSDHADHAVGLVLQVRAELGEQEVALDPARAQHPLGVAGRPGTWASAGASSISESARVLPPSACMSSISSSIRLAIADRHRSIRSCGRRSRGPPPGRRGPGAGHRRSDGGGVGYREPTDLVRRAGVVETSSPLTTTGTPGAAPVAAGASEGRGLSLGLPGDGVEASLVPYLLSGKVSRNAPARSASAAVH